jgi:hypothetical protein
MMATHAFPHHIPKEYKDLALHMSLNENVSDVDIHHYVWISSRAMRRLNLLHGHVDMCGRIVAP